MVEETQAIGAAEPLLLAVLGDEPEDVPAVPLGRLALEDADQLPLREPTRREDALALNGTAPNLVAQVLHACSSGRSAYSARQSGFAMACRFVTA